MTHSFQQHAQGEATAEAAVADPLSLLQALIQQSPTVAFRWRAEPQSWPVEFVLPNIQAVFGYPAEDLIAGHVSWPAITHPEDVPRLEAEVSDYLGRGVNTWSQEYRGITRAGETCWCRDWNQATRGSGGAVTHVQALVADITEFQRAQEERQRYARQLAQLASDLTLAEHRERRRMAARLHDCLQQPLVGARLQVEALLGVQVPENRPPFENLLRAIREALDVTRHMTQELAPPFQLHRSLADALRWSARQFSTRHQLDITVSTGHLPDEVPESVAVLLHTAARELLLNVAKHAGTRQVGLRLRTDREALVLEVSDCGTGFSAETLLPTGTPRGFGLFSIRERAELLGGTLKVESVPGQGAQVTLTLPLRLADAADCD